MRQHVIRTVTSADMAGRIVGTTAMTDMAHRVVSTAATADMSDRIVRAAATTDMAGRIVGATALADMADGIVGAAAGEGWGRDGRQRGGGGKDECERGLCVHGGFPFPFGRAGHAGENAAAALTAP